MSAYEELKTALHEFMEAAASRDASRVSAALGRVCSLQERLGADVPPMLLHYLERRSYQKALDFLSTGITDTENPR